MAKRIIDASDAYQRIEISDKPMQPVDPAEVAKSLGAEIIGRNSSPGDHIGAYGAMRTLLDRKKEEESAAGEQEQISTEELATKS